MEIVKYSAIALCLASTGTEAQSPYLSVNASMDARISTGKKYRIEMKICQPQKRTQGGDWFTPDTSTINFSGLKKSEVECGEFQYNGEGIEVLSGNVRYEQHNSYSFSNQVFAWEKILVFRITDETTGDTLNPKRMYLVLPVKYKSFVTAISIDSIPFVEGNILDLDRSLGAYKDGRLSMRLKPDRTTAIPFDTFAGRAWIE